MLIHLNIRDLNNLMIMNDTKNRLPRGKRYVNEGLVHQVRSMVDTQYNALDIYGKVISQETREMYDTNISIDLSGHALIYTECSCEDFIKNSDFNSKYICKHVAATFYRFIDVLEEKIKEENENGGNKNIAQVKRSDIDYSELLLKELKEQSGENKEKLDLEVTLEKKSYFRGEAFFEASFKIGNGRPYVMKNVPEFVKARIRDEKLVYGKSFTYDPRIHYFSEEDERIVEFIEEYAGLNDALDKSLSYGRAQSGPIAKNKSLIIPQQSLRRFLECASHKEINFIEKEEPIKIQIVKGDLPLAFKVEENDEGISLSGNENMPKALNYKGDVFIYDGKIYLPSIAQARRYKAFYSVLKEKEKITFKGDKKQEVFSKVLPVLDTITEEVNIDQELKDNIIKEEAKVEIFFDRDRKDTWATVNLNYGKESFNFITGPANDQYIIRDLKKENEVEKALNHLLFYRDKDKFYFEGSEEELYDFLLSDLNSLKEIGEVYYSDRFKERRVYGHASMKGSIKKEGNSNFLEFTFEIEDVDQKELAGILKAFNNKRRYYKLKNDSFVNLTDEKVRNFFNMVEVLGQDDELREANRIKIHRNRALYLDEAIKEGDLGFIEGKDIVSHISEKIKTLDQIDYHIPKDLNATLRDYQLTGFKWFKTLSHYEFGGILADEMGLGKTLQTITFLLSEKEEKKKSLVVAPTSLIYNWKSEFENFAPTMKVIVLHGGKDEREKIMEALDDYDVLLTTYGTLKNDFEWYEKREFDYCIIDEGQNIKNPLSLSSEAVKDVKAKVKFALTGTPIENNLLELWSIFDFVMPGYLYGKNRFQEKFVGTAEGTKNLKKLIQPFILRRLKKDVMKDLPDKVEKKYFIEMKEEQKKVYASFVKDIKEKMNDKDAAKDKITVFSYLTKLRQLCLDPGITVEGYHGGSGKIEAAIDIVKGTIEEGRKILLFSQFTTALDSLKKELDKNKIEYFYLDGSTKADERIRLVNEFNKSDEVSLFLISLKAGGTGLNLTSADMVIHFDPWWNPAIEDQATDRAHRFGQKNMVEVIKLIAKGSIEEKILKLQDAKKEVISQIMSGDYKNGNFLGSLSEEEIKDLFN